MPPDVGKIGGSTNDLLELLTRILAAQNAAAALAESIGIPMSPNTPFYRMGEPLVIPVSPTSAADRFAGKDGADLILPPNITTFRVTNNNPFAVRLRGQRKGGEFTPVTNKTGWLFMPGEVAIYGSLLPIALSAMSVNGPLASQVAGSGFLELQYGTGG